MEHLPSPDIGPVLDDLADRGFETTRLDGRGTPAAVARGGSAPAAVTDRPLSVEPLGTATPLALVARLADAARNRRGTLFVAAPDTAAAARDVLEAPLLRPATDDAARGFYAIPDRIRLSDGTLAAIDATSDQHWHEDPPGGVSGESRSLVLSVGGDAVAALPSVDALTCPGPDPSAFPYRYVREDDRRIHCYGRDREIGVFTGLTAMKDAGFHPVDLPLVPEHHLRENAHLARRWSLAVVADGDVQTYVTP